MSIKGSTSRFWGLFSWFYFLKAPHKPLAPAELHQTLEGVRQVSADSL